MDHQASPPPAAANPAATRRQQSLAVFDRYEGEFLDEKNTLRSSLGLLNAGLLRMAFFSQEVLVEAMTGLTAPAPGTEFSDPEGHLATPVERLERLQPLVNGHVRLMRQITQLANFDGRAKPPAEKGPVDNHVLRRMLDRLREAGLGEAPDDLRRHDPPTMAGELEQLLRNRRDPRTGNRRHP